jgi:hypothetical protein
MSILIISFPDDMHAYALIWALARKGVPCRFWSTESFPERQRVTVRMSNSKDTQVDVASLGSMLRFDTVWLRHVTPPQSVSEKLAPSDRSMALSEAKRCVDGALAVMAPNAAWINPPETRRLSNVKAHQLEVARKVGLVIPETIISNDPVEIRAFAREHHGDIIYKPFAPATWRDSEKGTLWRLFTAALSPEILNQETAMTSCPGIYQARLAKRADVRVVFFGDTFYGARICSQATEEGTLDFRSDLRQRAPLEAYPITATTYDQCNEFRKQLGLLHGSFDFVEQPDGTLIFLEINEMGQFLWLEEKVPGLPLLDAFAAFSLEPVASFRHTPDINRVAFHDFIKSEDYVRARELVQAYWESSTSTSMEFTYSE